LNQTKQLASVLIGKCSFLLLLVELDQAQHHVEEMRRLGKGRNDVIWECFISYTGGDTCCFLGKFIEARAQYENALSLWNPMFRAVAPSPEDPCVVSLMNLSRTLRCLGYLDQSRLRRDEGLAEARHL
jgi:hypothetical protein